MKRRRLELPRHNCHYPLKVARLPIPPPLQHFNYHFEHLCPRQDSNLHVVKHTHLKRARLPIPPLGLKMKTDIEYTNQLSGKRDSDPRPQPWQGCTLPTELFPLISFPRSEEEETRTPTTQLSLPPQSSASTNSATSPFSKTPYSKQNFTLFQNVERKTGLGPATPTLARLCSTN